MDEVSLRETRDLLKQVREDILLRPSGLRPVHLIHCRRSRSCGDTATVRSGNEIDILDGDRSMANRRDILESELQDVIRIAFETGWDFGSENLPNPEFCMYAELKEAYRMLNENLHELLISHLDGPTGDVGAQDETSEEGEMGDGVRSERGLGNFGFTYTPIEEAYDEIVKEIYGRLKHDETIEPIGHAKLTENPDGSIHASIIFGSTKPQVNGAI